MVKLATMWSCFRLTSSDVISGMLLDAIPKFTLRSCCMLMRSGLPA